MKPGRNEERVGILAAARTIIWAFLGIGHRRRNEQHVRLTPLQIVIAGLLGGAMFVLALVTLVTAIVRSHGAAT